MSQTCHELSPRCHRSVTNLSRDVTEMSQLVTEISHTSRHDRDVLYSPCCVLQYFAKLRFGADHKHYHTNTCHKIVTEMSRDCHAMSPVVRCHRCVATCHQDVTAESHICHKLSQGVTTAVTSITPSHRVSKHLLTCRHVDISRLRGGGSNTLL